MSASQYDLYQLYWWLHVQGPKTLVQIIERTNWTRHRTNDALQRLRRQGCVQLTERRQHEGAAWFNSLTHRSARTRCGIWSAIPALSVERDIVDAIVLERA